MHALEIIAERRIEEAVERGELQGLPGDGRPLDLDDEDPLLPCELRMAKRILRNADLAPVDILREMRYEGVARSARVAGTEKVASAGTVPIARTCSSGPQRPRAGAARSSRARARPRRG
jgi:hypothetical protein